MKNKRIITAAVAAIAALGMLTGCSGGGQSGTADNYMPGGFTNDSSYVPPATGVDANIKVTSAEWNNIQWQSYTHQYATLQIPTGWKVEVTDLYQGGTTGSGTLVSVKSPDESVMIAYVDFYAIPQMMMSAPTVEALLTDVVVPSNNGKIQNFTIKSTYQTEEQKQFVQSEAMGAYDAKIVTADHVFNGKSYEGAYSAAITGKNMAYSGVYMAVSLISVDVPKGDMKNWEPVVGKVLSSIQWTPACTARYNGTSIGSSGGSSSSSSDLIMEAWNSRNQSEDIMSQKRSDATLGQERVVDTYTGDIYKANNGFYDTYSSMGGTRYTPITDDQYTQGYSGYLTF